MSTVIRAYCEKCGKPLKLMFGVIVTICDKCFRKALKEQETAPEPEGAD